MDNLDDNDDIQLSLMAKQGNDLAFYELMMRYLPFIKSKAYNASGTNGVEYDDLLQEGLLGLLSAVKSFNSNSNTEFSAYACVCIRNRIISACRTASTQKNLFLNSFVSLNDDMFDIPAGFDTQPEEVFINKENLKVINDKIANILSYQERKVITLRLIGYSYKEIASILSITPKKVDNYLQSIKRKINMK